MADSPAEEARFLPFKRDDLDDKGIKALQKQLVDHLYRSEAMPVFYCRPLKLWSRYGESRDQLAARAQLLMREKRDGDVDKLRKKYAPKIDKLTERIRKAEQRVARESSQTNYQAFDTAVSVGSTVVGALFGGRSAFTGARSAVRGAGRVARERGDVSRARDDVAVLKTKLYELQDAFDADVEALESQPLEVPIRRQERAPQERRHFGDAVRHSLVAMTLLSACLIVKNEERHLARCLTSIATVADEVVVVDTGSEDDTVAIAKQHGAKTSFFAWCDDYAAARNASLAEATGAFILYIDADEELHPDDAPRLRALLESGNVDAVQVAIVSPLASGMTNVARYLRVFRNYPGIHFVEPIHEQIWPALAVHEPRVADTELRILHHGYAVSEDAIDRKRRRNLDGALRVLERQPDNAFYLYHAGIGHLTLSEPDKAMPWLERALRHAQGGERPVILNALAQACFDQKEHRQAEQHLRQSVELEPRQIHGWGLLADVLLLAQRHAEAIRALRAALAVARSALHTDVRPDRAVLHMKLGMCELLTHAPAEAEHSLGAALASETLSPEDQATAERYRAMAQRMLDARG